jgi:ATP-dependent DNA helicase DinG
MTVVDTVTQLPHIPENFSVVEGAFAAHLPGYEPRKPQQAMASAIEVALADSRSLYVQAGCGTGKSLGGMVPALLQALHQKTRLIVATATKALQEQYANSDIPFLQEHSGIPFTWALVKGRSNYTCQVKLNSDDMEHDATAQAVKAELAADEEHSGDREHFGVQIDDLAWRKLSSGSSECPGKSQCPFGEVCYAEKAKKKGNESDLVITNQAMLATDLVIREKTRSENSDGIAMLGDYGIVLLDEGHEWPEIVANTLGNEFTPRGVPFLLRDALSFVSLHGGNGDDENPAAAAMQQRVDECSKIMNQLDELALPLVGEALTQSWFVDHYGPFADLNDLLKSVYLDLRGVKVRNDVDRQQGKLKLLLTRIENTLKVLEELLFSEDHERVRWVDGYKVREEDHWRLKVAPVDVAPFLTKMLWEETPTIVMSATLSAGKDRNGNADFGYIKRTSGLEDAGTVDVGTPFDLPKQARMFVPAPTQPSPKEYGAWSGYAIRTTLELVDAAKGGALLLYTSRKAMEAAHEDLKDRLEDRGLTVLMQGDGRSNKELAKIFKADTHSVLFALKSFFVGVDVPGDACRLVIVDKLPFPVPSDPIFQARALAEERAGRRSFSTLSIPMMTLSLEQAVGRLIRTKTDKGVVAILDSRLTSTPYGRGIVTALPNFPVTTKISDVQEFYGGQTTSDRPESTLADLAAGPQATVGEVTTAWKNGLR